VTAAPTPALRARDVHKSYGRHHVLRGADLSVHPVVSDNLTVDQHLRYFAAAHHLPDLARGEELVDRLGYREYRHQTARSPPRSGSVCGTRPATGSPPSCWSRSSPSGTC
jgi:hypothetical protein